MSVFTLWVLAFGRVAIVLALAACLGYPVARRVVAGLERGCVAVIVGLGLLSLLVCVLGWLHLFTGLSVAAVAAVAGVWAARSLIADRADLRRGFASLRLPYPLAGCLVLVVVALLAFSLLALYPTTDVTGDAGNYHLPMAEDLIRHHGLIYDPFVRFSFFPQGNESVFAVMLMVWHSSVACSALEYSLLTTLVIWIPIWFRRSGRSVVAGLVAALLVLASPVVIWTGTSAFVDTWTMCFVTAGLLTGLDAAEARLPPLPGLFLSGGLFGCAAAAKYSGAAFAACAVVAIAIAAGRKKLRFSWLAAAGAGFAAAAMPWYAWTLHTTGDPVYPLAVGLFGNRHGLWTATEIHLQDAVQRGIPTPGVLNVLHRDWQYLKGEVGYSTGFDSPLSRLLLLLPASLLLPRVWRDRTLIGTIAASFLCFAFDVFIGADPRDFVPALGVLAVAGGMASNAVVDGVRSRLQASARRVVGTMVSLAAAGLCLWPAIAYARTFMETNGTPPATEHALQAYRTDHAACYAAIHWLNRHTGARYRAWASDCGGVRFYANGTLISDVFSTGGVLRIFDNFGTTIPAATTLCQRLKPLHVSWLIIAKNRKPNPGELDRHGLFSLATATQNDDVFRISSRC